MRISILSLGLLATSLASLVFADDDCREIVRFPLTLTWEKGAPDGFERDMILMNGQFPGPTLEMNEGASVEVGSGRKTAFKS
jgi:FtsP/CotA-like multicopper oxidase with cupredoxin domain